jgi:hypothetical protein
MAPPALGSGREVSESVFEALLLEMAAHYAQPGALLPPKAALESIGFQVGYQLVERCVCASWHEGSVGVELTQRTRTAQLLARQAAFHGAPGGDQVHLQRVLERGVQKAG